MFLAPIFKALISILLLFQPVHSVPVQEKDYLYLGPEKILELPSLAEVPCKQGFWTTGTYPHKYISATAAVVPYGGADTLMICGLTWDLRGCYVWRQGGWELSDTLFNGSYAASSKLADGRWLVTGGKGRNGTEIDAILSSARAYSEVEGWRAFPSLPAPRNMHCQVTVGSAVYVIGGSDSWYGEPSTSVFILSEDQVWAQGESLSEDQVWAQGESLPSPVAGHSCSVVGSKIYVIGGYRLQEVTSSVYILDTSTPGGSWVSGPELPLPRSRSQAFVYDNTLYLLGGSSIETVTDVWKLSPEAKTWTVVPGSNVTDTRAIFPAPFIGNVSMHCY